jgi:uncharacterized NAD-dependent epimerase/dehydratase family protein
MDIQKPYVLFLGDVPDQLAAKTAVGIVDWRKDWCVGQIRLEGCQADTGLEDITLQQAVDKGAKSLVIGAVNAGGILPEHWVDTIVAALEKGLDIASGLHMRLSANARIKHTAEARHKKLFDVRHANQTFATGQGTKRSGKRLLTVGTDCSAGKKYTALAIEQGMRDKGFDAEFKATGQTGILISGRGVALDAVVSDFISGAAEWLSPAADDNHWDIIEGQGSLFHPSFAGVTLGLLHGSQPDAFIVCHEPTRTTMRNVLHPLPTIRDVIDATLAFGRLTNPAIRCVGISINTQKLSEADARTVISETSSYHGLPATDPVRFGVEAIVEHIAAVYGVDKGRL